jgi:hypothetical protein
MIKLLFATLLFHSCGAPEQRKAPKPDIRQDGDSEAVSLTREIARNLRGYSEINHYVKSEIVASEDFDIALYLGPKPQGFLKVIDTGALHRMLGSERSDGMRTTVEGAQPNAMNMLLWNIVVSGFSSDIDNWCSGRESEMYQKFVLHENFKATILSFCDRNTQSPDNLQELYNQVISIQKTADHERAWIRFHNSYFDAEENKQRVHSLMYSLMYSPEFLVRR